MKMVVKSTILMFAVFGAVLMLSAAFVQPVSARASGQVSILQKYDYYIKTSEKLDKSLSSDKTIKTLSDRLSKNSKLNKIVDQVKNAKTDDELKILAENFVNTLKKQREYKQIMQIINTKYGKEIKTLETFSNKLQNKPDDAKNLLNALVNKYNVKSMRPNDDLYAMKATPYNAPHHSSNKNVDVAKARVVTSGSFKYAESPHLKTTGTVVVNGNHHGSSGNVLSAHASVKLDANGNVYVWVQNHGWMNFNKWICLLGWMIFTTGWFSIELAILFWPIPPSTILLLIGLILVIIGVAIIRGAGCPIPRP